MDSLFHFILALMAGMVVGLHKKHGLRIIFFFAVIAVLIDLDHFLGWIVLKPFHTIFVAVVFPLALFLFFYKYEKKGSIKWQSYSLILLVVLVSHIIADFFYPVDHGVPLFYPLSTALYMMPQYAWGIDQGYIFTPISLAFAAGFLVFLSAHFIEDFIFYFKKKHMSAKTSWKKVFSQV